jgi:G:T-mismatch repair DNA endonuclease (very short patch repair protein)
MYTSKTQYYYKTISLESEMINKNDVIVVAMATMPFQHGRHWHLHEKTSGYPTDIH